MKKRIILENSFIFLPLNLISRRGLIVTEISIPHEEKTSTYYLPLDLESTTEYSISLKIDEKKTAHVLLAGSTHLEPWNRHFR